MCCLAYENDNYIQAKQQMPHIGAMLETPSGPGKVVSINVPQNAVEVMLESGVTIHIPVNNQPNCGSCSNASICGSIKSDGGSCGTGCACRSGGNTNSTSGCGSCSVKKKL
jgi:hypothetical protein